MAKKKRLTKKQILAELMAIGFARATDYLCVQDGVLTVLPTRELPPDAGAAIAAIERTSNGLKVKFYDKLKALELLGKYLGLFEGKTQPEGEKNNLLEALLAATGEGGSLDDLQELQQAAAPGNDLVESSEAEGV